MNRVYHTADDARVLVRAIDVALDLQDATLLDALALVLGGRFERRDVTRARHLITRAFAAHGGRHDLSAYQRAHDVLASLSLEAA